MEDEIVLGRIIFFRTKCRMIHFGTDGMVLERRIFNVMICSRNFFSTKCVATDFADEMFPTTFFCRNILQKMFGKK